MTTNEWRRAGQDNRHLVLRLAAHGFHNNFCTKERCHKADETYIYVVDAEWLALNIMQPNAHWQIQ